jgi:UDP-glucose 4-epimerase
MRALVTGGAGFIGSHLVDALVDAGHDVLVVDDLSSGSRENLARAFQRGARLVEQDVLAATDMRRLLMADPRDVVFHLAAQISVSRAVADPLADAAANVMGTLSMLEAARAGGSRRFVLASTGGAIYGDAAEIPTREQAPLAPLSPYGTGKSAAEQYVALYGRVHGISALTLRLANVYGPRQDASGEGGVVARFCRARVDGVPAAVFGDGLQTRDYVYVGDVVEAFRMAGESAATGRLNVGTGAETTVLDLVAALALAPDFRPARPGEVRRSCLDASAARRALGWRARTPLARGIAETLAFEAEHRPARPAAERAA